MIFLFTVCMLSTFQCTIFYSLSFVFMVKRYIVIGVNERSSMKLTLYVCTSTLAMGFLHYCIKMVSELLLHGIIIIMKQCLLWVLWCISHISIVIDWPFLFLARCQHTLQGNADCHNAQDRRPFISQNRRAYMSIGIHMWMNWSLLPIRYNKLDGR